MRNATNSTSLELDVSFPSRDWNIDIMFSEKLVTLHGLKNKLVEFYFPLWIYLDMRTFATCSSTSTFFTYKK